MQSTAIYAIGQSANPSKPIKAHQSPPNRPSRPAVCRCQLTNSKQHGRRNRTVVDCPLANPFQISGIKDVRPEIARQKRYTVLLILVELPLQCAESRSLSDRVKSLLAFLSVYRRHGVWKLSIGCRQQVGCIASADGFKRGHGGNRQSPGGIGVILIRCSPSLPAAIRPRRRPAAESYLSSLKK